MRNRNREKLQRGCLGVASGIFILLMGAVLLVASSLDTFLKDVRKRLPSATELASFEPSQTTQIFSGDGKLIATLYRENRTWVNLSQVSPWMVKAVLAIEDSRFYEHHGIDPIGVFRAVMASWKEGDRQGASTVTMQLARNVFLSSDQTMERKIKEALMAIEIEKSFTKDEIMEMYLNQIYLGSGAYGVQAASKLYFNKGVKHLTPAQSALLAGLPQHPNKYSPLVDEVAGRERAREVLGRMREKRYLDEAAYQRALAEVETMKFYNKDREEFQILEVPYFTTYVIKQLYKRFDEDTLYRGGFKIYTTVDLSLQAKAEKTLRELIQRDGQYLNASSGALVCIENKTGYIRAMVGGMKWTRANQFNRAFQARRQPGSSFKPFIYATALECGMTPDTVVQDTPLTVDNWSPKNSDGRFMGSISLAVALQYSRNVVSVRLAQFCGLKRIIDYAKEAGIEEELPEVLSLSLGAADITPLEMAGAYTIFPNAGIKVPSSGIKLIVDADGNTVEDNRVPPAREVLSEPTATGMVEMMKRVVEAGTAGNAYIEHHEVGGKTGTTDSFRDAWFIGFTNEYTTAVWVGNDDYSKMWSSFGGDLPARIWHDFMVYAMRNVKSSKLARGSTRQVSCLFCSESSQRAGPGCPKVFRRLMGRREVPQQFCMTHGAPKVSVASKATDKNDKKDEKKPDAPAAAPPSPEAPPVPRQVELPPPDAPVAIPLDPPPAVPMDSAPDPGPAPVPVEVPLELPPPPQPVVPIAPSKAEEES